MKKQIEVSLKVSADDAQFDQTVSGMARKLQTQITQAFKGATTGGTGGTGGASPQSALGAGMEAFYKNLNALRNNMDQAMRNHAREQMRFSKDISKEEERRNRLLQDQERLTKSKIKDLEKEASLTKEIADANQKISGLQAQSGSNKVAFNAAQGANAGQTMPVFITNWPPAMMGNGPGGGRGSGGGNQGANGNFFSGLGKSLGLAAAALGTGAALIDQYTQLPLTTASAGGNMTQSIVGGRLQELYRGDVISSMAWQKEHQRAMEMAGGKFNSRMATGPMNVLGGALSLMKGAVTGEGAGHDANANFLTGAIGKTLGGITSLGGLAPNRVSEAIDSQSNKYFNAQQSQLMEDFGKNYTDMMSAQQKANPLKNLAADYLQNRYMTDIQSQRMMGMGDRGFYGAGGYMEGANKAGFTGDLAMEQSRAIQGAGGSTRAMRGLGTGALRFQRGFDLTNAGSLLGNISGGAGNGDAAASERILTKIIAEGMKIGLGDSEQVEELRKFSQQTAEVLSQSGAVTGDDVDRILRSISAFQIQDRAPTTKEQQGALEAFQQYQQFSAETSGRGGAIQFATFYQQGLGRIGNKAIASLMEMPEKDITETNERVVAIAAANNMSPSELVRKVLIAKQRKADVEVGFNSKNRDLLQQYGLTGTYTYDELMDKTKDMSEKDRAAVLNAYQESELAPSIRSPYSTPQKAEAEALRFRRGGSLNESTFGPMTEDEAMRQGQISGRLEGGMTGTPEGARGADETIKGAGVAAQAFLENFRNFKDQITPASDALDTFTKRLVIFATVLGMTPDSDKAATAKWLADNLYNTPASPSSANQAGKPRTGATGSW